MGHGSHSWRLCTYHIQAFIYHNTTGSSCIEIASWLWKLCIEKRRRWVLLTRINFVVTMCEQTTIYLFLLQWCPGFTTRKLNSKPHGLSAGITGIRCHKHFGGLMEGVRQWKSKDASICRSYWNISSCVHFSLLHDNITKSKISRSKLNTLSLPINKYKDPPRSSFRCNAWCASCLLFPSYHHTSQLPRIIHKTYKHNNRRERSNLASVIPGNPSQSY